MIYVLLGSTMEPLTFILLLLLLFFLTSQVNLLLRTNAISTSKVKVLIMQFMYRMDTANSLVIACEASRIFPYLMDVLFFCVG
jgi:hypothetical protein